MSRETQPLQTTSPLTFARERSSRTARRREREKSLGTLRKVLDATCDVLCEHGHAGATIARVAARARTTQAVVHRHFPTRESLLVTVSEDLWEQLFSSFERSFRFRRAGDEPLRDALELVRAHLKTKPSQALFELMMASRTDHALREALEPKVLLRSQAVHGLALELLPDLGRALGDKFFLVIDTVLATFEGEALRSFGIDDEELSTARVELLVQVILQLGSGARALPHAAE